MTQKAFVRTEMLPPREAPSSVIGPRAWLRENLFSNWFHSILTILSGAFVLLVLIETVPWLFSPTWGGTSLNNCREILAEAGRDGGACWGVISERWPQLMFGFYPSELYWRPILAFILLAVAMAPVLFSDKVPASCCISRRPIRSSFHGFCGVAASGPPSWSRPGSQWAGASMPWPIASATAFSR